MEFKVILEFDQDESCWASYVPALDNISTWGRTREEALKNTEEVITGYLEAHYGKRAFHGPNRGSLNSRT